MKNNYQIYSEVNRSNWRAIVDDGLPGLNGTIMSILRVNLRLSSKPKNILKFRSAELTITELSPLLYYFRPVSRVCTWVLFQNKYINSRFRILEIYWSEIWNSQLFLLWHNHLTYTLSPMALKSMTVQADKNGDRLKTGLNTYCSIQESWITLKPVFTWLIGKAARVVLI